MIIVETPTEAHPLQEVTDSDNLVVSANDVLQNHPSLTGNGDMPSAVVHGDDTDWSDSSASLLEVDHNCTSQPVAQCSSEPSTASTAEPSVDSSGLLLPSAAKRKLEETDIKGDAAAKKKKIIFPKIRAEEKCGTCHHCLNPQLRKACIPARRKQEKELQVRLSEQAGKLGGLSTAPSEPDGAISAAPEWTNELAGKLTAAGGMLDKHVSFFEDVMSQEDDVIGRTLILEIINKTDSVPALKQLVSSGRLKVLQKWLADACDASSESRVVKVLQILARMPVDYESLKNNSNSIAMFVGKLRKHTSENVKREAQKLVNLWKQLVSAGPSTVRPEIRKDEPPAKKVKREDVQQVKGALADGNMKGMSAPGVQIKMLDEDEELPKHATLPKKVAVAPVPQRKVHKLQLVGKDFKPAVAAVTSPSAATPPAAGSDTPSTAAAAAPAADGPHTPHAAASSVGTVPEATTTPSTPAATAGTSPADPSSAEAAGKPSTCASSEAAPAGGSGAGPGPGSTAAEAAGSNPGTRDTGGSKVTSLSAGPSQRLGSLTSFGAATTSITRIGGSFGSSYLSTIRGPQPSAAALRAAEAAARHRSPERVPRREKLKKVAWAPDDKLLHVRQFKKEDPASAVREGAEEELAMPQDAGPHAPAGFEQQARKEHAAERELLQKHMRDEGQQLRDRLDAMCPTIPWATPRHTPLDPNWCVAAGVDSEEAKIQPLRERPLPRRPPSLNGLHLPATPIEPPHEDDYDPSIVYSIPLNVPQPMAPQLPQHQQPHMGIPAAYAQPGAPLGPHLGPPGAAQPVPGHHLPPHAAAPHHLPPASISPSIAPAADPNFLGIPPIPHDPHLHQHGLHLAHPAMHHADAGPGQRPVRMSRFSGQPPELRGPPAAREQRATCLFFNTAKGCRNGERCKFRHVHLDNAVDVGAAIQAISARHAGPFGPGSRLSRPGRSDGSDSDDGRPDRRDKGRERYRGRDRPHSRSRPKSRP